MTSAERLCLVAARSEALLADFVILFLIRWGLKYLGLDYVYYQPVLDETAPPLMLSDFRYPASAVFYGSMYFVSGLPELILAGMWFAYATIMIALFGQTLGMRQAGIVIKDLNDNKPRFWRVLARQVAAPFSSIGWLGYWPAAFSAHASALHDIISGTKLIYAEKKQAELSSETTHDPTACSDLGRGKDAD